MEEFIIIFTKKDEEYLPYICSKNILLNDKIFFESEGSFQISEGVVSNLDIENQLVTIISNNEQQIVNYKNCFFPIIEVYKEDKEFKHKEIVTRNDFTLSTICPHCEKNSRELENCNELPSDCKKNKTKSYAFIKKTS